MSNSLSRRNFLGAASGVAAGATLGVPLINRPGFPAVHIRQGTKNVASASANGLRGVELAGRLMAEGMDTLDAAIEGVKIQELDPEDSSVGYGGLPNEDGVVQLDASCMHGPTENMRRGLSPTDAALETLRRVVATTESRLLDERGRPAFNLSFYATSKAGEFGGGSIWSGGQYAAFDGAAAALHDLPYLYERN